MRRAARVDANQAEIIKGLREIGARVYYIKEPMDLIVGYRKKTVILEVKTEEGRLTKQQAEFLSEWDGGPAFVVRNRDEAVNLIVRECA